MSGSLKIARIAGIGIFVHWTFLLLLAWIGFAHLAKRDSFAMILEGLGFVLALFTCVVLHELGHALTAKCFGVKTRDITLLPIGGVARLEKIPEAPMQEFLVAVAGPMVNVVIAALLLAVILIVGEIVVEPTALTLVGGSFLIKLMWVNIGLVLFNMLPAFPMDGGRVLRALLATQMPRVRATYVAAAVGKAMAVLFGFGGIMTGHWMLLFIAIFVYLGAQAEAQAVEMRAILQGVRVGDAMVTRFVTLSESDTVERAARESSSGEQKDFPVTNGKKITGVLFHADLVAALTNHAMDSPLADLIRRDCPTAQANDPLDQAIDKMQTCRCSTLLVERDRDLVGLLSDEHLGQWVQLHASFHNRPSA